MKDALHVHPCPVVVNVFAVVVGSQVDTVFLHLKMQKKEFLTTNFTSILTQMRANSTNLAGLYDVRSRVFPQGCQDVVLHPRHEALPGVVRVLDPEAVGVVDVHNLEALLLQERIWVITFNSIKILTNLLAQFGGVDPADL